MNHIDTAQYYGPDATNELIHEALDRIPYDLLVELSAHGTRMIAAD